VEDALTEDRKKELCNEFGLSYWDNWDPDKLSFAIMDKLSEMSRRQNDLIRYLSTIRIVSE
jgi:hypothetical protein